LKTLAGIGVLEEIKVGREKLFIHPKFVDLLTGDTHQFRPYEKSKRVTAKAKPGKARTATR
ncbi:MAG: hypothetical protein ACTS5I_16290, partial [Rhodanobacter sp.]